MRNIVMPERLCQRPGCGNAIPSHKRRDARWCSRRCESKARRQAARKARFEVANPGSAELLGAENQGLAESYDRAAHLGDDDRLDDDYPDRRTAGQREQDARFAAVIAGDDVGGMRSQHTPRRMPRETWRAWRAYGKRHGTEHPEQTADRVTRQRAAEAASMQRLDSMTAGRVQDRFDPRTSGNIAASAVSSRKLNSHHVEQPPPSGPGAQWDFQAESVDGGPYRSGRASGQQSRHADYRWDLPDGFTF